MTSILIRMRWNEEQRHVEYGLFGALHETTIFLCASDRILTFFNDFFLVLIQIGNHMVLVSVAIGQGWMSGLN